MSFFSRLWAAFTNFFTGRDAVTPKTILDEATAVSAIVATVLPQAVPVAAGMAVADRIVAVVTPATHAAPATVTVATVPAQ